MKKKNYLAIRLEKHDIANLQRLKELHAKITPENLFFCPADAQLVDMCFRALGHTFYGTWEDAK